MTPKVEVTTKYKMGHTYVDNFLKTDYHCPGCGAKEVWEGTKEDYYAGPDMVCVSCESSFNLPSGVSKEDEEALDNGRRSAINAIKASK